MPNRMLHSDITTSKSLNRVSHGAERTFFRLTTLCDDRGRYHGDRGILRSHLYPVDGVATPDEVNEFLAELETQGCVHFYRAGEDPYVHLPNWEKYQRLRNYRPKFPDPAEFCESCKGTPQTAAESGQRRPRTEEKRTELKRTEENLDLDASVSETPGRIKKSLQDFPGEHITIGNALRSAIPKSMPGQPVPDLEDPKFYKWLTQIRLLLTVDNDKNAGGKWTTALVLEVVKWLPTHEARDGFKWGEQILSGRALRKHFPKLLIAKGKTDGRRGSSAQWEQMRKDEEKQSVDGGTHF